MKKKKFGLRLWMQIGFFVLIALIALNHTLGLPWLSGASLHAICPFGGVETAYSLLSTGLSIPKVHMASVALLPIVLLLSLIVGPVFCAWVCPLGSIQEWIGRLGRRLLGKRYNKLLPTRVEYYLGFLRYAVLGLVVYNTARSGALLFAEMDPYYALFQFWTGEVALTALLVLALTLVASLVIERPWCKFACPFGALLGLFNKIRLLPIRRNPKTCVACHLCSRDCPLNIDVEKQSVIRDNRCISCLECTSERSCPKAETVALSFRALTGGQDK